MSHMLMSDAKVARGRVQYRIRMRNHAREHEGSSQKTVGQSQKSAAHESHPTAPAVQSQAYFPNMLEVSAIRVLGPHDHTSLIGNYI